METSKEFVKRLFPKRKKDSHKGNFGRLLVIGGSRVYSGSPALAALGALKTGTDMAIVAAPERAANIAAGFSPSIISYPLKGDWLNIWHIKSLLKIAERCDAVVVGGGMERNIHTGAFIQQLLPKLEKPMVIDADAIHYIKGRVRNAVITPHGGEFSLLAKHPPKNSIDEKIRQVAGTARKHGCVVLLKGPEDIISDGIRTGINKTGNAYMTKGGTGDVLAGVCGGLLARGTRPFDAAAAAAWITGSAGDLAAKEFGESMMAENVLDKIPKVLKGVLGQ